MTSPTRPVLLPAENMVLTVARAQLKRGENPPIDITAVLVTALDRLTNGVGWQEPDGAAAAELERIRQLHQPIDRGRVMPCCEGCEAINGEFHQDCCHEWPCPTIDLLRKSQP